MQNWPYFSENKKIRKKVLTFAFGGVIITKEAMVTGNADKGILICRSGYGMTVVANKFKGVRCV